MNTQLNPHPTPESFSMEHVTREQFFAWLMAQTVDIQTSAHHSPFLEGKVWSEFRLGQIGPIIGRSYSDFMGRSINHMLLPSYAKEARDLAPEAPAR